MQRKAIIPLPEKHIFQNQPDVKFFDLEEKEFENIYKLRLELKRDEDTINYHLKQNRNWWIEIVKKHNIDTAKEEWLLNEEKKRIELKNLVELKMNSSEPSPEPVYPAIDDNRTSLKEAAGSNLEHLLRQPQPLFKFLRAEYPDEKDDGGIYIHLEGLKYPTKGFPFPDACQAVNIVKRFFIGQIRLLAKNPIAALSLLRKKNLEKWLREMCSTAEIALEQYYLKEYRYTKVCRELRKLVENFLLNWGIYKDVAGSFAQTFVTLIEYDDAYRMIVQDLANETSLTKLCEDPVKELERLLKILKERDQRPGMLERFGSIVFLLKLAFKFPGVKKSFLNALRMVNFSQIQMDEADRYHALRWSRYNFFGLDLDTRLQKFVEIHDGKLPHLVVMQSKA